MIAMPDARRVLERPGRDRIAEIELLRGISILMVLASHIPVLLPRPMPGLAHIFDHYVDFWSGVDLFFAISGFVIARSLLPALAAAPSRAEAFVVAIGFWIRRAWRLLPSAWLWLAIILAAAAFFNRSLHFGYFHDNFEAVVAAYLNVANIHFCMAFGHFGLGASAPYWSLSLEEQFYLGLPMLAIALRRHLLSALIGLTILFFLVPETYGILACVRLQPILLGVLLAFFERSGLHCVVEPVFLGRYRAARLLCLLAPLALMSALSAFQQRIVPFRFDMIAVLAATLVFVAGYDRGYCLAPGPVRRLLTWIGARSYALYLVHTPVFCGTNELFFRLTGHLVPDPSLTLPALAIGLGLALLLADLNYRFLETPLRRHGRRIARAFEARSAPIPAAARAVPSE